MSVSSGFFNSTNGDRRYNAEQMSAIFDGIINDGVFSSVGTAFAVNAQGSDVITVGVGRAWFNSTWLYNDGVLPITLEASDLLLDRYDAVVIEIDRSDSVRAGFIKVVKGTPSTNPEKPAMANSTYVHQYPLAYIYRKAESAGVTQADVTNCIGTSACPYVNGVLEVQTIDKIVAQWEAEFNAWFDTVKDVTGGGDGTNLAERIVDIEASGINESHLVKNTISESFTIQNLLSRTTTTFFTNWVDNTNFPGNYGSGVMVPCQDGDHRVIFYSGAVNNDDVSYIGKAKRVNGVWTVTWVKNSTSNEYLKLNGGGMVTGQVSVRNAVNGYGALAKNNSDTADYGTDLRDTNAAGDLAKLTLSANNKKVTFTAGGTQHTMLHTGNSAAVVISQNAPSDTSALWVY